MFHAHVPTRLPMPIANWVNYMMSAMSANSLVSRPLESFTGQIGRFSAPGQYFYTDFDVVDRVHGLLTLLERAGLVKKSVHSASVHQWILCQNTVF